MCVCCCGIDLHFQIIHLYNCWERALVTQAVLNKTKCACISTFSIVFLSFLREHRPLLLSPTNWSLFYFQSFEKSQLKVFFVSFCSSELLLHRGHMDREQSEQKRLFSVVTAFYFTARQVLSSNADIFTLVHVTLPGCKAFLFSTTTFFPTALFFLFCNFLFTLLSIRTWYVVHCF